MKFRESLLIAVAFTASLSAQGSPQSSIQVGDLDRKADPCTDFFQYANGTWRANNPIPASMSRWSRRWKAGEDAKEQLKDILDDVSRRTDWPRGSTEELISDYYGSCMDESRIDKAALAPAEPTLKGANAMKTPSDLQRAIRHLQDPGLAVPIASCSSPDNHTPAHTI